MKKKMYNSHEPRSSEYRAYFDAKMTNVDRSNIVQVFDKFLGKFTNGLDCVYTIQIVHKSNLAN